MCLCEGQRRGKARVDDVCAKNNARGDGVRRAAFFASSHGDVDWIQHPGVCPGCGDERGDTLNISGSKLVLAVQLLSGWKMDVCAKKTHFAICSLQNSNQMFVRPQLPLLFVRRETDQSTADSPSLSSLLGPRIAKERSIQETSSTSFIFGSTTDEIASNRVEGQAKPCAARLLPTLEATVHMSSSRVSGAATSRP